jgi:hypothetical protein
VDAVRSIADGCGVVSATAVFEEATPHPAP